MRRRLLISALCLAAVATAVPAASAGPETVLSYGRNVDGSCTFDDDPFIPAGSAFRLDGDCRLLVRPAAASGGIEIASTPAPKYVHKRDYDSPGGAIGAGGGVGGGVSLYRVDEAATMANDAANDGGATAGSRLFEGSIVMFGIDERDRIMYQDVMRFQFLRRPDGTMYGFYPVESQAYCRTGGATAAGVEYSSEIHDCWRKVVVAGGSRFEFDSAGIYSTTTWLGGYPRDPGRKMQGRFLSFKSGWSRAGSGCGDLGGNWPPLWRGECDVREDPLS